MEIEQNLDLTKYTGLWYEIAKYPQPFEAGCDGPITAYYSLNPDQTIKVDNRCYDRYGRLKFQALGTAKVLDPNQPAMLRVDFPGSPFNFGSGPNYIIHNTNYWYSIVGTLDKTGLYILCRAPTMSASFLKILFVYVQALGYDPRKISIN